jgi:hydroxyethylthiazole kinase-like uncharacterized protein yjeF
MARIDAAAEASGLSVVSLMERAGQAVAAAALRYYPQALRFVVLCGGGNNGGDGYVAARALHESGAEVAVYHLGDLDGLKGAARSALEACPMKAQPLEIYRPERGDVVIDAIFGAGLSRDVPQEVARIINAVRKAGVPVLAVDLPSGLCGRRGVPLGCAFQAERTITFVARKPGHVLMPGRSLCGTLEVFDIGVPARIVQEHAGVVAENAPSCWSHALPRLGEETHKFKRGHLSVFSGPLHATGAARLTATAGLKSGAGIVSILAPSEAVPVLSATLTAVMVSQLDTNGELAVWQSDKRHATYVLGPGFGDFEKARQFVAALKNEALVLDADGITAFRDSPEELFALFAAAAPRILTPHEGEFARLFPQIASNNALSKVEKAQVAAALSNAVIIYKGADTVIASPDGRARVNTNAPPFLATAGSGDVLAGIAGGLLAQGVPAFEAASAAVWLHGLAGQRAGPGLTAEYLVAVLRPFNEADACD